jgi:hypothetical protein
LLFAGMENAIDKGIEIDSNYRLIQVFNYINQDQRSQVFVYQGVQFWRQDFQFIMSYNEKQFIAGDILYFDEFTQMLKDQKRGEKH